MANLIQFSEAIVQNGGASFNLLTGDLNPKQGYMVSIKGHEVVRKAPANEKALRYFIADYIREKAVILAGDVNGTQHNYLGAWVHEGLLYLDVSMVIPSLGQAIEAAKRNNQKAFYENATGIVWHVTEVTDLRSNPATVLFGREN